MFKLVFTKGPEKGKELAIREGSVAITAEGNCRMAGGDRFNSGPWALIEQRGKEIRVYDRGLPTGLLLNGEPIAHTELKPGDVLQVGPHRIRFEQAIPELIKHARRLNRFQSLAMGAILVVIAFEIVFVAILLLWKTDKKEVAHPLMRTEAIPVEESLDAIDLVQPPPHEQETPLPEAITVVQENSLPEESEALLKSLGPPIIEEEIEMSSGEIEGVKIDAGEPVAAAEEEPLVPDPEPTAESEEPAPEAAPTASVIASQAAVRELESQYGLPENPLFEVARTMLEEAMVHVQQGMYEDAAVAIRRVQVVAPDYYPAYVLRARLFQDRGMNEQAQSEWEHLAERAQDTPWAELAAQEISLWRK